MGARTTQERLVQEPLPRIANLRIVQKPLLSATTLAAFLYCHTKPFLERVLSRLGLDHVTPAMRAGAFAHAQVQGALEADATPSDLSFPQALAQRAFLFATELHLVDPRNRMHGYVDIVFARDGHLNVLELKNTRPPRDPDPRLGVRVWPEHGVQLSFYGVLSRRLFGSEPRLWLTYLQGGKKEAALAELQSSGDPEAALVGLAEASARVPQGPAERTWIVDEARRFRRAEQGTSAPPPSHADPAKCARCGPRAFCPYRLDAPGKFAPLEAALLADGP